MARSWRHIKEEQAKQHPLYGIKNWLAVFAFGNIFGLGTSIGTLNTIATKSGISLGELLSIESPAISFVKLVVVIEVVQVFVILGFLFTKHPKFRIMASLLLLASWPVIALFGLANSFEGLGNILGIAFLQWLIPCLVWVTYLQRSRRVRVTFEHCVLSSDRNFPETSQLAAQNTLINPPILSTNTNNNRREQKDDEIWADALDEFEGSSRHKGLWVRCFAHSDGNEARAKAMYLRERVAEKMSAVAPEAVSQVGETIKDVEPSRAEGRHEIDLSTSEKCTSELASLGYKITQASDEVWEVEAPSVVISYARSEEALRTLASRYIKHHRQES